MSKNDIKCDECNGNRLVKTITGVSPCFKCNGCGVLKADLEPYREWEVITMLLGENRQLRRQNYLLKQPQPESKEQHDGRGRNNYRGD